MKYLLSLVLLLTGCASSFRTASPAIENPPPPPIVIAAGSNGQVEWRCQLNDLNPVLAWVECDFRNTLPRAVSPACITVTFFDEASHKLIAESRKFCSGVMPAWHVSTNYAAFYKENRKALRKCGDDLSLCVMLAVGTEP